MQTRLNSLTVFGSGSYGTALAIAVASKGCEVKLYARDAQKAQIMNESCENSFYLKGIKFPITLSVSSNLQECVNFSNNLLIVVPSHSFKSLLEQIKPFLTQNHTLSWATKGLETQSLDFLSDVVKKTLGTKIKMAAISGPTFARELACGMPTAIALAGNDEDYCHYMCNLLHTKSFRIYQSHDLISLQLGGAVKNVIAIAAGLSDGLGYGANARTALITRGLAEMVRLGLSMGANEKGFMGLSGLGDLILTCTDDQSRNRRFGYMLGQGLSIEEAKKRIAQVVEGYTMVDVIYRLSQVKQVQMPICTELYRVLFENKDPKEAANTLLSRALTKE